MTSELSAKQIREYMPYMDDGLSAEYMAAILFDQETFHVGKGLIRQWEARKKDSEERTALLVKTAENNNIGISLEKAGDVEGAIKIYEENIQLGYPALHSYERLMILYRKKKMTDDEIRIIDKGMELFSNLNNYAKHVEKWTKRRLKIKVE